MDKKAQVKYSAPALDKGLDILEHLSEVGIPLTQGEIAQGVQRTPSEIYRMLMRLEERGYLLRDGNPGKYRLSLKMYNLSHVHTPFDELKRVAQYPMQALSEAIRQSCHLSIMDEEKLLIIYQVRSPGTVSLSIQEGTHFPLARTTSGKVLLSMLSEEKRKEILKREPHFKNLSKEKQREFEVSIEQVREDGHCYSPSKFTKGVTDISVPIGPKNSEFNCVLAVSTLTSNLEEEIDMQEILKAVKKTQQEINKLIGV